MHQDQASIANADAPDANTADRPVDWDGFKEYRVWVQWMGFGPCPRRYVSLPAEGQNAIKDMGVKGKILIRRKCASKDLIVGGYADKAKSSHDDTKNRAHQLGLVPEVNVNLYVGKPPQSNKSQPVSAEGKSLLLCLCLTRSKGALYATDPIPR
jgi:hypothetical protein